MAAGITFNGGVTITGGILLGPTPDSIEVVATGPSAQDGSYAWGASAGSFGIVNSNYISALFNFEMTNNDSNGYTFLYVTPGSYSGFSVSNNVIDGDLPSYPRIFTIGGTNYEFSAYPYGYFATSDVADLKNKVGQVVKVIYNPAVQGAAPTPNTMLIKSYYNPSGMGNTSYGASGYFNYMTFGGLYSQYFNAIVYNTNTADTLISLREGNYTTFAVNSSGAIDTDTNGSTRKFTFDGVEVIGTFASSAFAYIASGDALSLMSKVNSTITIVYDPEAQAGGGGGAAGELASGTITVGDQFGMVYGWQAGQFGDSTFSMMGPIIAIKYDSSYPRTQINFLTGTYGSIVIDFDTVGGETSVTVVIDGITEVLTIASGTAQATVTGDPFGLANKVGQTLNVSVTPGIPQAGFVAGNAYTMNNDYSSLGITINGSTSEYEIRIVSFAWYNSAGYNELLALTTGSQFQVLANLDAGGTGDSLFTLTSGFVDQGPFYQATATASVALQTNGVTPETVTLPAAAAGTTYTSSNWTSGSWEDMGGWRVSLSLGSTPESSFLTALNALTTGDTIAITDNNNVTETRTITSISGQPYSSYSQVIIYTDSAPPGNTSWWTIDSIAI